MLQRQAKTLSAAQVRAVETHLRGTRHPLRNRVIFLLSLRAGLRAKEIAELTWSMVTDPARHSSLAMTQRYIEVDSRAMQLVVDGW